VFLFLFFILAVYFLIASSALDPWPLCFSLLFCGSFFLFLTLLFALPCSVLRVPNYKTGSRKDGKSKILVRVLGLSR